MGGKHNEVEAILQEHEIVPIMTLARDRGPLHFALVAWCYEFGARISEPGMQLVREVDLRLNRARPSHLKQGQAPAWHPLLPFCREALPLWLVERATWDLHLKQREVFFPSKIKTGRCYTCKGKGKRLRLRREEGKRFTDGSTAKCEVCRGTGQRWGLAAVEAYRIVHGILVDAGIPDGRNHPHVLRHSIITHLLNAGTAPKVVQDRVGHRNLETTLNYARVTDRALAEMESKLDGQGIYAGWTK